MGCSITGQTSKALYGRLHYQEQKAWSFRVASATREQKKEGSATVAEGRCVATPALSPCPYSPECVEGEFCELRRLGILRSWRRKLQ